MQAGRSTTTAADKIDVFLREYMIDFNGKRAAIAAGYEASGAKTRAHELLSRQDVDAKLQVLLAERAQRTGITADLVLQRLHAISTADPRELIEVHRVCCRYCYGKGHRFHFTPRELEEAKRAHVQAWLAASKDVKGARKTPPPFDECGGVGYDPRREPSNDCPECWGQGEVRVIAKDSRDLSPSARLLYAGAKQTQHGLEIKMLDQVGTLRDIGRHLGMFKDKVEHTGKDGEDIKLTVAGILSELDGSAIGPR